MRFENQSSLFSLIFCPSSLISSPVFPIWSSLLSLLYSFKTFSRNIQCWRPVLVLEVSPAEPSAVEIDITVGLGVFQMNVRLSRRRPSLSGSTPICPECPAGSQTSTWTWGMVECSSNCWRFCQERNWWVPTITAERLLLWKWLFVTEMGPMAL